MKILILINNDVGLYKFRKELVLELLKKNEIYVSLPYGKYIEYFKEIGCKYIETNISRHGTNPFQDLKLLKKYISIVREIKPNVVLTYTIKPNIYGGIACKKLHIPYIVNITGLGNAIENNGILQKITLTLYKIALKKANKVFFQNKENCEFMLSKKIINNNYDVLPGSGVNLIDNPYENYPIDNGKLVFVTIGRILKDKGIDELLESIKILKQKYDNIVFKLVGSFDGDYEEKINKAINDNLIDYLGYREDIHDIIKNSNATIHPSYHEGTSNVLLETAACGRPILASNIPGCNNVVDDNISGFLFEPKNVDSLVDCIERFINTTYAEKILIGKKAREKVENEFSRNIIIEKYIEEIDSLEMQNEII